MARILFQIFLFHQADGTEESGRRAIGGFLLPLLFTLGLELFTLLGILLVLLYYDAF